MVISWRCGEPCAAPVDVIGSEYDHTIGTPPQLEFATLVEAFAQYHREACLRLRQVQESLNHGPPECKIFQTRYNCSTVTIRLANTCGLMSCIPVDRWSCSERILLLSLTE